MHYGGVGGLEGWGGMGWHEREVARWVMLARGREAGGAGARGEGWTIGLPDVGSSGPRRLRSGGMYTCAFGGGGGCPDAGGLRGGCPREVGGITRVGLYA